MTNTSCDKAVKLRQLAHISCFFPDDFCPHNWTIGLGRVKKNGPVDMSGVRSPVWSPMSREVCYYIHRRSGY